MKQDQSFASYEPFTLKHAINSRCLQLGTVRMTISTSSEFISAEDLAAYTGMTAHYWGRLRLSGKGPVFYPFSHKVVRYRRTDVDRWLEERARTKTGEALAA